MRRKGIGTSAAAWLLVGAAFTAVAVRPLVAQMGQTVRIAGLIDNSRTITIPGHLNPRAQAGTDNGLVEASFPLNQVVVTLKPSAAQQADLAQFLAAQQNPASPDFHNWLTPAQFADRFGPAPDDIDQISAWLSGEGFTVQAVAASRNWIAVSGTAGAAEHAFGVAIHRYTVAGQSHFATATEPHVPAAIAGLIAGFRGFDDFLPQAIRPKIHAAYTSGSGTNYLAPDDAATIYNFNVLYQQGYDGTGQTLAVIGQSAISLSDIDEFRSIFDLPKNDPALVTVPGLPVPGVVSGDELESDLDLEWAGAVAKNASLTFVYSNSAFNSLQYAVSENLASVISSSYGLCEAGNFAEGASLRAIAQQANAQGITLLSASGDDGAFGCEGGNSTVASRGVSVTLPASIPEVTGVGGTEFNEGSGTYWSATNNTNNGSALSYIPETAWNETVSGGQIGASGGGASVLFDKPVWQAGTGVPADGARDVPDVAIAAGADHDGAIVCTNGGCVNGLAGSRGSGGATIVGGTSLATPIFAGIAALVNHYQVKSGALAKAGLGNINPTLYPLAQNYPDAFHDITTGNNVVPCKTGTSGCTTGSFGYQAGPGYDQVTGLGSVNGYSLATNWSLIKAAPAALSSLTVSPASAIPGATVAVTATLTAAAPSTGATVVLSGGTSVFPLPASISISAGQFSASVNVIAGPVTASTPVTITGTYSGAVKTATVTIAPVVLPTLSSVSVSPSTVAGGASAILTVTLNAAASTGGVTVALSSSSTAFPVQATLLVPAGAKTAGVTVQTSTVTASTSATVTATYNGGSLTAGVTITPVALAAIHSISISPTSLTGGSSAILTVTLSAAAPTGAATVALASNSSAFPVPPSVVVPAGQKNTSLRVQTAGVTVPTSATVTATYGGGTATASITITAVALPTLRSVSVSPSTVIGGAGAFLTVILSAAAPTGGATVTLSSNSAAFPVPANLVVPAGQNNANLTVNSSAVTRSTSATVTAAYNGGSGTASVTITPVVLPTLSAVTLPQSTVNGGANVFLTVVLSAGAPPGGANVSLASNNAAFPVPASLVVPSGQKVANATVQTSAVAASTQVTITAKYNGSTQTASLTLTPATLPALSSVAISQSNLGATIVVTLSGAAPAGGATVTLSSNSPAISVPANTVVPAGEKIAAILEPISAVTVSTAVTVSATYNGVTETASITLAPVVLPTLSSISITPSTLVGGERAVLSIQLSGAAPQAGASVSLSSNSAAFPVPASVNAGLGGVLLNVTTAAVTTTTSVKVSATYNNKTVTATATLTPVVTPSLAGVSASPASVTGGSEVTLNFTLSGPAPPAGATIALSSSNGALPLPSAVTMLSGYTSGSLGVRTRSVTASVTATITASSGGTTQTATITITP